MSLASLVASRIPVDPSTEEARAWLERELAKPAYADHRSLLQRVIDWIVGFLSGTQGSAGVPGWVLPAVLVTLAGVGTALVLVKVRREPGSRRDDRRGAVLDEVDVDAAGYRRRARRAFEEGDHEAATADWFRAIAAAAADRTIIDAGPGRTAHEVSVALAAVFPEERAALAAAADHFDGIRYGEAHVDATIASFVAALDDRLAAAQPFRQRTTVAP